MFLILNYNWKDFVHYIFQTMSEQAQITQKLKNFQNEN